MNFDKKIQAKKLLTRAATLALLVKERKRATAVRKQTAAAVHIKQQEALEKKLTAALSPMFSRQIDSAIKKLNQHEDLHGVRAWMLLDPSEWDDEIVNRALPPMAKAMAEAMLTEVVMFEKDLRRYVKSTRLMRKCGGPGSGVPGPCPSGQSPSYLAVLSDPERDTLGDYIRSASYYRRIDIAPDFSDDDDRAKRELLRKAVAKAPRFLGEMHRGLGGLQEDFFDKVKPGAPIEIEAISSFSADPVVAHSFVGMRQDTTQGSIGAVLTVRSSGSGKDISSFGRGAALAKEVLVEKGTQYRVVSVSEVKSTQKSAWHPGGVPYREVVLEETSGKSVTKRQKTPQPNGVVDISRFGDAGVDVHSYIHVGSKIKPKRIKNEGTFDPSNPDIFKQTYVRTKATSATAWLQDNFPTTDLEEVVYTTPYGNVAMNLATEFPGWMKASIRERLEETFSQSYWDDINMTTQGDIADLLNEGLENGWSVEKMAKEMNERYGEAYSKNRGRLIARTESGNALNGARVGAIDDLIGELGPEIAGTIRKVWHSVLGNTTRDTHANLDGVPADSDGRWALGGVRCRWPGDVILPAKERCNCQCTVITQFGMSDAYAQEEIAQSEIRQMQQGKSVKTAGASGVNCGIGPGGFQPGNTCAKGGGSLKPEDLQDAEGEWLHSVVGKTSGVDLDLLGPAGAIKDHYVSRIGRLEKAFLEGKWPPTDASFFDAMDSWKKSNSPHSQLVIKAYDNLNALHAAKLQELPAGAKPTKTDLAVASDKGWVKTGGSLGTEKGGTYEMGGKKYYVKTPDDPARAHNEVLAFKLYEAAGGSVVKSSLVEIDGKTAIATEWEDMQKIDWSKNTSAKIAAAEDFALHAWLNNRDAVGAGSENPMDNIKSNTGKPTLVDAGGSLNYQGMGGGGKKPFGKDAKEWDSLRDPSINPTMAKVFGDMTLQQLISSGEKLKNITDRMIDDLVSQYHGGPVFSQAVMASTLKKRRGAILKKVEELKAGLVIKSPDPVVQQSPAKQQKVAKVAAASAGPVSLPPPPHAGPQVVKDKMAELYTAASSGDINKLHAVKTNPNATSAYPKKMHEYKMQLMTAMQAGGKPVQSHVVQPPATAPKPAPVAISSSPQVTLAGPVKINPGGFPSKPTFTSSNKANVAANDTAATNALKLAETGDLAALQAHGQTIPNSPKLKAWHQALVDEVANQLNPPPPPVFLERDFSAASAHISPKAVENAKKIGHWAVLGEVPGIPAGYSKGDWLENKTKKAQLWKEGKEAVHSSGALDELKSYTGGGYASMNQSLRDGDFDSKSGKQALKAASAVMQHGTTLPQGIKLSRKHGGVQSSDWYSVKPGAIISEKGMLSTSVSKGVWQGSTKLVMTVGPGVKGMPVKAVSSHKSEDEVILPPNQRMLVTKVEKEKSSWGDDSVIVHVTILPTLDTQCCPP